MEAVGLSGLLDPRSPDEDRARRPAAPAAREAIDRAATLAAGGAIPDGEDWIVNAHHSREWAAAASKPSTCCPTLTASCRTGPWVGSRGRYLRVPEAARIQGARAAALTWSGCKADHFKLLGNTMAAPVIAQLVAGFARALRPAWAVGDPWRSGKAQAALRADACEVARPRGQLSLELAWATAATHGRSPALHSQAEAGTGTGREELDPIGLSNVSGAACYANAVSQILLADPGLEDWLEQEGQQTVGTRARPWLRWLLGHGTTGGAGPLAAWTGLPSAPGPADWGIGPGQQDAHEFLLRCLEQTGIAHRYSFEAGASGLCHLVALASEPARKGATLEETAESWAAAELPLGRCNRLLLYLPGVAWDRHGPRECTPVWANGAGARRLALRPGGAPEWRLTACAAHSGARDAGHYVAYVTKGNGWWRCSDATVTRAGASSVEAPGGERIALALLCKGQEEHRG